MEGSWSLGFLIGLPVTIVIVTGLLIAAGLLLRRWRKDIGYDPDAAGALGAIALVLALIVVGFALSPLGFYPYKAEYHRWEPVTGTVAAIESRLLPEGNGMQEKFVVTFEGSDQQYGIEDTRAALVEVGDEITITCMRSWQYAGVDGYDCNWAGGESS